MDADRLSRANWSQPWLSAVADGCALVTAADPLAALNREARRRRVSTAVGSPIEFVDGADAPAGRAYEVHIAATGRVPTRLNAHDLMNALVWLAMPRTKARLNALHAGAFERSAGGDRGPLRDAATLFDENGALLVTRDGTLPALLRARRWHEAFVEQRHGWSAVRLLCFGHALMVKLMSPYKAITAHLRVIDLPVDTTLPALDHAMSAQIDDGFRTSLLLPLPVLGVPGWCAANADPAYYEDVAVFRPARIVSPTVRPSCDSDSPAQCSARHLPDDGQRIRTDFARSVECTKP